jgi:outer membrane autotransporter barrel domain protein
MVFALIAIISCESSGGSGSGSGSGINNGSGTPIAKNGPSYSQPSTGARFTLPNFSNLKLNKSYATPTIVKEDMEQANSNVIALTHYNVGENEIGFKLPDNYNSLSPTLNIASPTTMDVKGFAISRNMAGTAINPEQLVNDMLTKYMTNSNNLTLNMHPGSSIFLFESVTADLSMTDSNSLMSLVPRNQRPTINGTDYNVAEFHNSHIFIDKDVNLDDPNDLYNKLNAPNSTFEVPKYLVRKQVTIAGSKPNQIAIQSIDSGKSGANVNGGVINLTGDSSFGAYIKNGEFHNKGIISVGKNSIGIYSYEDGNGKAHESNGYIENNLFSSINLGENSIGMYYYKRYNDVSGDATNNGIIKSEANNAIGIVANINDQKLDPASIIDSYSNDYVSSSNNELIDLSGDKSIGFYVTGKGRTKVFNTSSNMSKSNKIKIGDSSDKYNPSMGMYSDNPNANLENHGEIEIGKNSIGMAGIGTLINDNYGIIKITKDGGVGMYLGKDAIGVNNGLITTEGTPNDAVGVVVGKDAEFTNNGTIHIDSNGGAGIVIAGGTVKNYGNIEISGGAVRDRVDNSYQVTVQSSDRKLLSSDMKVYVDSLGRTKPIEGLANLGLKSADLLIGAEATEKTNDTEVTVGDDVLAPFNNSMQTSNIKNWNVKTGSLVWQANPEILNNKIAKVTLKKLSYANFADDEMTQDVARGLDEKYKVANSNDKEIFNYLNTVNSKKTFADTYREVSGNQYANVQQRISKTDDILNNRISDLQKENADESGHHVSTFFDKNKHSSKVQGIADSDSSAYGISYLFNNADAKQGIYAGAINNNFKLKDNGRSKENISMLEVGGYKTFDVNSLEWTLDGNGFVSQNNMKRRFVVGNNSYENKANYNAYGVNLTNELGKTFNVGGNFTVKPYAALKLGYGRFNKIKEKDGTLNVEVKANDYYSVRPGAGVEFGFSSPVSAKGTKFKASLGLGYDHELGKVDDRVNEVKFTDTNTRIRLKSAKDEKKGNFRSDLKVGFETGKFDVSVNGGYDTKDKNSHVGVGLGVSF